MEHWKRRICGYTTIEPGSKGISLPALFEQRALPPAELGKSYHQYTFTGNAAELMKRDGVRIEVSRVAEGFGRDGGGLQLRLFKADPTGPGMIELTVQDMLDGGYLR